MQYLERSLHLYPASPAVWKSLGHTLAQNGRLDAACRAFSASVSLAPETNLEARVALATTLTQVGNAAAATDQLLFVRSRDSSSAMATFIAEPLERLCRRLMPAQRFASIQSVQRTSAWRDAIIEIVPGQRVLDISSTPFPAMLAARLGGARWPVLHVQSNLPETVITNLLSANNCLVEADPVQYGQDTKVVIEPSTLLAHLTHMLLKGAPSSPRFPSLCYVVFAEVLWLVHLCTWQMFLWACFQKYHARMRRPSSISNMQGY